MSESVRRLIFATKNRGKMKEVREILGDAYEVLSLDDAGISLNAEETGESFEENALIKARAAHKSAVELSKASPGGPSYANCPVLADDSGLVIDALGGMPGIYSARWMGEDTPYEEKNARIIEMMKDVPEAKRSARFIGVIAAVFPDGTELVTRGDMEGLIGQKSMGQNGFGYDPLLYLPEYGRTAAELSPDEKNAASHRGKSLRAMKEMLEKR